MPVLAERQIKSRNGEAILNKCQTGLRRIIGGVTYSPEQFAGNASPTTTIERSTHMIRFATAAIILSLAAVSAAKAQTKADEEAVHNLPQAFIAAFNKHDGHQLAQIMADDVDFVTVGAMWLHGKPDFEKWHTRLLQGRFHGIKTEVLQVAVRFLRPEERQ
jgi:hypothetical protein